MQSLLRSRIPEKRDSQSKIRYFNCDSCVNKEKKNYLYSEDIETVHWTLYKGQWEFTHVNYLNIGMRVKVCFMHTFPERTNLGENFHFHFFNISLKKSIQAMCRFTQNSFALVLRCYTTRLRRMESMQLMSFFSFYQLLKVCWYITQKSQIRKKLHIYMCHLCE